MKLKATIGISIFALIFAILSFGGLNDARILRIDEQNGTSKSEEVYNLTTVSKAASEEGKGMPAVNNPSGDSSLDHSDAGSSSKGNENVATIKDGELIIPESMREFVLSAETVNAVAGSSSVSVDVKLRNNPGILAMVLSLYYDDSVLTLVDAESGEALSPLTFTKPGRYISPCRFLWDGQELDTKDIKDGTVLTLYFDVAKDAAPGNYPIRILAGNRDILDTELNALNAEFEAGSIVVD